MNHVTITLLLCSSLVCDFYDMNLDVLLFEFFCLVCVFFTVFLGNCLTFTSHTVDTILPLQE